ncbi:MAG: malto-oligosyltrehalose synthase [Burkholderiaceae bacterium]
MTPTSERPADAPTRKAAVIGRRRDQAVVPRATARLQFHKDFTFDQATALVPYYARLGISHLYASPILKARAGSTHGYDCVDVSLVNPELGGEDALRRLAGAIHAAGMGLVVDIVPNHMGIGHENAWWQDVLLWGPNSRYAHYFDIDWVSSDPALRGKLLAPFLGAGYGETLASGDLVLAFDAASTSFEARYFDNRFPIAIADYAAILNGTGDTGLTDVARRFERTAEIGDLPRNDVRERETLMGQRDALLIDAKAALATALEADGRSAAIERSLARYATAGQQGRARLHSLLENQAYRLSSWRAAADEINWRRFFEVTDLAGIRVERDDVFDAMHATTFRLFREGVIDAVRVDHVDGLSDPRGYCRELQRSLEALQDERPASRSSRTWIVVEKILAADEDLRADWKVDGTSGYDFMNEVGALLHEPQGAEPLAAFWSAATSRPADFKTEQTAARRQILAENLAAEFNTAARSLHRVARADVDTRDIALIAIQRALTELLVQFDVYRTYVDTRGRSTADTEVIVRALRAAHATVRPSDRAVLAWLDHWLGGDTQDDTHTDVVPQTATRRQRDERRRAITKFQQLTPPLAAKSVEDTAFYRYGRLISRNEVGSDPGDFALSIDEFHAKCRRRAAAFPHAMLAIATHDHKRGADARARLAVLSEMPQRWIATLRRWMILNTSIEERVAMIQEVVEENAPMTPPAGLAAQAHSVAESAAVPLPEDQIMLMQTLIGAWPLELAGAIDGDDAATRAHVAAFVERVAGWQVKALRETKRPSDWSMPNESYEALCRAFLDRIMDVATSPFVREAANFVASIGPAAALNGLVQAALHLTVPGIPDLYQGTEWWDFSMVDPDNRRPVDFAARRRALDAIGDELDTADLVAQWRDGRVKQALIARLLALRAERPALFASGDYRALTVEGLHASHVLAFMRRSGADRMLVVVPVHAAALLDGASRPLIDPSRWGDTAVLLPPGTASNAWFDVVTGKRRKSVSRRLKLGALLADLPVAVLRDAARG